MKMSVMRMRMCLCLGVVLIVASGLDFFLSFSFLFLCCETAIGGHLDLVESIENDSEKVRKAL